MVNKCEYLECVTYAVFNIASETKGIFCKIHKKEGMVDVISKRCNYIGCEIRPNFNLPSKKQGIFCSLHKKPEMINVVSKRCNYIGCEIQASFNLPSKKQGIFCSLHKKEGMVDGKHKNCNYIGCEIQGSFNIASETKGIFCKLHKTPDMINVVSKRCNYIGCNTLSNFNLPSKKQGIFCSLHKKEGMINVVSKNCNYIGCNTLSNFNLPNEKRGIFCKLHKKEGMVDVISKKCKTHLCEIRPQIKYKGYCLRCFMYTFPDEPITRNYKVKEKIVTDYIVENFKDEEFIFDKQVSGGCSKRRPDCFIDKITHIVIVECDEFQHANTSCENKRIAELYNDVATKIVFIRFNPDKYKNSNGDIIKSCFTTNDSGICVLKDKVSWNERLRDLKKTIYNSLNSIPIKEITIIKMFYDEI
jgi:hypothetical protein